jgi:hypothetical protein
MKLFKNSAILIIVIMRDFSKGKIYKIIDTYNDDVYIGCTTQSLKERFTGHHLFDIYDKIKDDCKIVLIENYPCNSRRELLERERYHIANNDCINKMKCNWYEDGDYIIFKNVFT